MQLYEILPHTADVRLQVTGTTLQELFIAALEGMNEIIRPGACRGELTLTERADVAVESSDTTALLIDFLAEVLTLTHERYTVFCGVEFSELTAIRLTAQISGRRVEQFDEDIKAVTYHGADVRRDAQGNYGTIIVFDI